MAKNIAVLVGGGLKTLPAVAATYPTTPESGDPVIVCGTIPAIALISEDADGEIVPVLGPVIAEVPVGGVDGDGNSAVQHGQPLYYTAADDPPLNKKNTGIPFGIAFSSVTGSKSGNLVAAGASAVIRVLVNGA